MEATETDDQGIEVEMFAASPPVDDTQLALVIAVWVMIGVIYFAPGLIAILRGHPNAAAILMLNILLGWTFLGWSIAVIWALTHIEKKPKRRYGVSEPDWT